MQTPNEKKLATLLQRKLDLEHQVQKVRTEMEKEARALRKKKALIIGDVVLELVESGLWSEAQLTALLDPKVFGKKQRALFGLDMPSSAPKGGRSTSKTSAEPVSHRQESRAAEVAMGLTHQRQTVARHVQEKVTAAGISGSM